MEHNNNRNNRQMLFFRKIKCPLNYKKQSTKKRSNQSIYLVAFHMINPSHEGSQDFLHYHHNHPSLYRILPTPDLLRVLK